MYSVHWQQKLPTPHTLAVHAAARSAKKAIEELSN